MQINCLFEDNHLLIVNKPAGLLTQPSGTDEESLEAQAKEWLKFKYQKPGNVFLHTAHRLDKPVSGIVIFAKTEKALQRLHALIRSQEIKKTYIAEVEGLLTETKGTLQHYLYQTEYQAKISHKNNPQAKQAILHYHVLGQTLDSTIVEIDLITGRYHQIRAQFSAIHHCIVGDYKYGSRRILEKGIALHHIRCQFIHPVTKQLLQIEAPLPTIFST